MPVTHVKTDTIPDMTQAELDALIANGQYPAGTLLADVVLPSDWNANHVVSGLTTANFATDHISQWNNDSGYVTSASSPVTSVNTMTGAVVISTITGNAGTATKWQTARTVAITGDLTYTSPSLDGSANVTAAGTLATVNSNVGTFGSATRTVTATVNGKGLVTAISEQTATPAVGSVTGLGTGVATALGVNVGTAGAFVTNGGALGTPSSGIATNLTGTAASLTAGNVTTNANLTGPITSVGNATTVANSINLPANPTTTTQSPADNSTKIATTAYVDNAVLGQRQKEAVKYASTTALPSIVYANGSSGVGATLTGVALAAISLDGSSPAVNDRVLIKNQASTFQNGLYVVTATGSGIAVFVLTRATDFDQASDIQTGDTVFVTAGATLANTTWTYNGIDSPVMGTDAITFVQAAGPGSYTAGNGIAITGTSIAIDTSVTVDKTTAQILSNKTFVAPALGTPASGVATNLTGTASSLTAGAVTNATLTTALTVNTGTVTLTGNVANTSALTLGAGASSISGANTGDQTITLTGAVTGSGTGSFATTIATPGTLTVASTNSTATAHTHAITSSSAPGAAASLLATDSSGIIGSTGTRIVKGWFTDLTVTNAITGSVTGSAGSTSGNAATATALQNARTIGGVSFDGTGNITVASATGGFTVSGGNLTTSAINIATDTTTGTKFGTATNQKISFFNSTPIVQPTGDVTTALQNLGLVATATIAANTITSRTLWGQAYDGSGNITGSQTGIGDMTGGASSMIITAGTGNSRTLTLRSTTSGGVATAFLTGNADQSSTFGGNISGTGAWSLTGGAGNMTIVSGTGNSRTMILQTTTSGGAATTALTLGADQSAAFAGAISVTGHTTFEGVTSTGATGTGKLVYDGTPTLVTPNIGVATGTSVALTAFSTLNATTGAAALPTALTGALLQIAGANSVSPLVQINSFAGAPNVTGQRANGTVASPTAVAADDGLLVMAGQGYYVTGGPAYTTTSKANFTIRGAEAWTSTAQGTYYSWTTTVIGGTTTNEKMRLSDVGNLKIGGTANRGTTEGTAQAVFFNGTAPAGTLANGASVYSASGVLQAMDATGQVTILSSTKSAPAISATKSADFTVLTYTPAAAAGQYLVSGVITTTSSTNTGTVQLTLDYVDSQGTTHTADVMPLCDAAGSIAATKTGASKEFHSLPYNITINNAATAIVLKVVITGTVSYTVTGFVEQIA